uniref:SET domain-containing protein n=1 Tax=Pseudonaja textilis TaxID=8673 RepID=A0A670ZK74_PSETE
MPGILRIIVLTDREGLQTSFLCLSFFPLTVCEICRLYFRDSCPQHGPPAFVANTPVPERAPSRALLSLPEGLQIKKRSQGGLGVWSALPTLPCGCIFGPYEGEVVQELSDCTLYSWVQNKGSYFFIDASDDSISNWMRYVACASAEHEQNLTVFQYQGSIYYRVCQIIPADTELLVWIGEEYARTVGLIYSSSLDQKKERSGQSLNFQVDAVWAMANPSLASGEIKGVESMFCNIYVRAHSNNKRNKNLIQWLRHQPRNPRDTEFWSYLRHESQLGVFGPVMVSLNARHQASVTDHWSIPVAASELLL